MDERLCLEGYTGNKFTAADGDLYLLLVHQSPRCINLVGCPMRKFGHAHNQ